MDKKLICPKCKNRFKERLSKTHNFACLESWCSRRKPEKDDDNLCRNCKDLKELFARDE